MRTPKKPPEQIAEEKFHQVGVARGNLANLASIIAFLRGEKGLAVTAALHDAMSELPNLLGEYSVAVEDYRAACEDVHG